MTKPTPRKKPGPTKRKSRKGAPVLTRKQILLQHCKSSLRLGVEISALLAVGLVGILAAMGLGADWYAGVELWSSLVPFAALVLLLGGVLFLALQLWFKLRKAACAKNPYLPAVLALLLASVVGWLASGESFRDSLVQLRSLVGGVRQAETTTLSHQVYAAYRRTDLTQMQILLERAKAYEATIQEAARAFGVDGEVMIGLGAAESSFIPRDSKDGGRGLFQITAPPKPALEAASKRLGETKLDWRNPRHNAYIAAATWKYYLGEMKDDLFLSLLAYNIGPKNGGLLSIMQQYGAKDFVTIQPYLQNLPRDYPIRVLTAALAYRLNNTTGQLLHYEESDNAKRIQAIGIPGLGPYAVGLGP